MRLLQSNAAYRIFLAYQSSGSDANPIRRVNFFPALLHRTCAGVGILTYCPSPPALAIGLGPTNPSLITVAKETLIFRRAGISPALRLLVPAFSLLSAPLWLTPLASLRTGRSLTALRLGTTYLAQDKLVYYKSILSETHSVESKDPQFRYYV